MIFPNPGDPAIGAGKDTSATRTSAVIKRLPERCAGRDAEIGTILDALEDRSFGALMILFALPNAAIPGISFILGAPVLLFALQLAIGRRQVWLPHLMRRRTISDNLFRAIVARVEKFLLWIEKWSRPRWTWLFSGAGERILGLYIAAVTVFLMLPVPFGNALPALGIAFMSVGLIEKDGKAAAFGVLLGFLGAIYIAAAIVLGVKGLRAIIGFL